MRAGLAIWMMGAIMAFFLPESAQARGPRQDQGTVETAVSGGGPPVIPEQMRAQAAALIVDPKTKEPVIDSQPSSLSQLELPYGVDPAQTLDVFYSGDEDGTAPMILLVHGGGWTGGDKRKMHQLVDFFVNLGFVVATPNYRLSSAGFTFPSPVQDVASAVAYMQRNASSYGADGGSIFLLGFSAGAHLAALVAYDDETNWLIGTPYEGDSLHIRGYIGLSGVYDFDLLPPARGRAVEQLLGSDLFGPGRWDSAEPVNFASVGDPPALLIAGTEDNFAKSDDISVYFSETLGSAGGRATLQLIEGYRHTSPFNFFLTDQRIWGEIQQFLETEVALLDSARDLAVLAYQLNQELGLDTTGNLWTNWGGSEEKWLQGREGQWYFILPTGNLFQWYGSSGARGTLIAELDPSYYVDPTLLYEARWSGPLPTPNEQKALASQLDQQLGLHTTGNLWTNWGGLEEKWVRGNAGQWYFITPGGNLFEWDRSSGRAIRGRWVALLNPSYYADPSLLYAAYSDGF